MVGLGVPIAGYIADRRGAVGVIIFGALLYAGGLYGMANSTTAGTLYLSARVLTGIGVAFTSFSLALAAMANSTIILRMDQCDMPQGMQAPARAMDHRQGQSNNHVPTGLSARISRK